MKYRTEEQAEDALKRLLGRFYAGVQLLPEYSPVIDFADVWTRPTKSSTWKTLSHLS